MKLSPVAIVLIAVMALALLSLIPGCKREVGAGSTASWEQVSVLDLGRIPGGEIRRWNLVYRNHTSNTLRVSRAGTSCGCLVLADDIAGEEVVPGEDLNLEVALDSSTLGSQKLDQSVWVFLDPGGRGILWKLEGVVQAPSHLLAPVVMVEANAPGHRFDARIVVRIPGPLAPLEPEVSLTGDSSALIGDLSCSVVESEQREFDHDYVIAIEGTAATCVSPTECGLRLHFDSRNGAETLPFSLVVYSSEILEVAPRRLILEHEGGRATGLIYIVPGYLGSSREPVSAFVSPANAATIERVADGVFRVSAGVGSEMVRDFQVFIEDANQRFASVPVHVVHARGPDPDKGQ